MTFLHKAATVADNPTVTDVHDIDNVPTISCTVWNRSLSDVSRDQADTPQRRFYYLTQINIDTEDLPPRYSSLTINNSDKHPLSPDYSIPWKQRPMSPEDQTRPSSSASTMRTNSTSITSMPSFDDEPYENPAFLGCTWYRLAKIFLVVLGCLALCAIFSIDVIKYHTKQRVFVTATHSPDEPNFPGYANLYDTDSYGNYDDTTTTSFLN